jgi:hypothetical protein
MSALPESTLDILAEFFRRYSADPFFLTPLEERKKGFEIALSEYMLQHISGTLITFLRCLSFRESNPDLPKTSTGTMKYLLEKTSTFFAFCKGSFLLKTDPYIVESWERILSLGIVKKFSCLENWLKFFNRSLLKKLVPIMGEKKEEWVNKVKEQCDLLRDELTAITRENFKLILVDGFSICCSDCSKIYSKEEKSPLLFATEPKSFSTEMGEFVIPCIAETVSYYCSNSAHITVKNNLILTEDFLMDKLNYFWHEYGRRIKNPMNPMNEILNDILSHNFIKGEVCLFIWMKSLILKLANQIIFVLDNDKNYEKLIIYAIVQQLYTEDVEKTIFPSCNGDKCQQKYDGKNIFVSK